MKKVTVNISYWYDAKAKGFTFNWPSPKPTQLPDLIPFQLPSSPEFANPEHINIFDKAHTLLTKVQQQGASLYPNYLVTYTPISHTPALPTTEPDQLTFFL